MLSGTGNLSSKQQLEAEVSLYVSFEHNVFFVCLFLSFQSERVYTLGLPYQLRRESHFSLLALLLLQLQQSSVKFFEKLRGVPERTGLAATSIETQ